MTKTPAVLEPQTQVWPLAAAQAQTSPWGQVAVQASHIRLFLIVLPLHSAQTAPFSFSPISPQHTCSSWWYSSLACAAPLAGPVDSGCLPLQPRNLIFKDETLMRQVQFLVLRLKGIAWMGYICKSCLSDIRGQAARVKGVTIALDILVPHILLAVLSNDPMKKMPHHSISRFSKRP